ncbi:ATPase [Brevibacillus daliensis]|uniref:ATPase n=1 Tax=Brevibacillus daliensis TaxID=2892995 RepID=UPI001E4149F3|nr:ATPase [Brevibacillus daliensis]
MFTLGQKVIIVGDSFEQSLPIGEHAYIIGRDRNPDTVYEWIIRVPIADRHYPIVTDDIALEETLLEEAAEQIQQEALLDFALATRNEALFRKVMGMHEHEPESELKKESAEDFIRIVNSKAWI